MTTHEVEEMLSITKKTLIYYENEGLVKLRVSKEGITFILTPKGHTFKKYGGFTALQKEEDDKLEKEKTPC